MRKMKNILTLCFMTLGLASCADYLDIKPVGQVIPQSVGDFRNFLTDAYSKVPNHKELTTYRTDELFLNTESEGIEQYKDIYLWNDEVRDLVTRSFPYAHFYDIIFNTNHVINSRDEIESADQDAVDQLVGEAYALRALQYFDLVNLYGNPYNENTASSDLAVPVVTKYDPEARYPRNTVQDSYDLILSDIASAEDLLNVEQYEVGYNYRFSIVALLGLKAKVALFMEHWELARSTAELALSIKPDLQDLNETHEMMACEYNSVESILALHDVTSADLLANASISEALIDSYDQNGDLRFSEFYQLRNGSYTSKKSSTDAFKSTLRTAELYLILAEANAQLGASSLDESKKALLTLAKARYMPQAYEVYATAVQAMNQQTLINEIWDERYREFALEGKRWNDLRRTTQKEIKRNFDGETYMLEQNDPRYTLSFPLEATINNPEL